MKHYDILNDDPGVITTQHSTSIIEDNDRKSVTRVYKRRWLNLLIFSLNFLFSGILYSSIAAINETASRYYQVQCSTIYWIPNSFLLVYVLTAIPTAYVISRFGLRVSVITASSFNAVAACLHFAGNNRNGYPALISGQLFGAFASVINQQIPAKLATTWFGVNEHAIATSIGYLMNTLGVALGYIMSTQMVIDADSMHVVGEGIFKMHIIHMIFAVSHMVLTFLAFADKPPVPPSHVAAFHTRPMAFSKSLKILFLDRDYELFLQGFSLLGGLFAFYSVALDKMVANKMNDPEIGWMGFSANIIAIFGMLLFAIIVDRYKSYKLVPAILLLASFLLWIGFTLTLLLTNMSKLLFCFFVFFRFFSCPFLSVGIERGTLIAYPVPEEISAGIMLIFLNMYGFLFVLMFGNWLDKDRIDLICYIIAGVFILGSIMVGVSRVRLTKLDFESSQEILER